MSLEYDKPLAAWESEGTEPELGRRSWAMRQKPPAAWFNWFWDAVQKCFVNIKTWIDGHETATDPHPQYGLGLLTGLKKGLMVYYYGPDDLRITRGTVHIKDATDHYVSKETETELTGESSNTGWEFITINGAGDFNVRAATGTAAQRPTDACFQFVNFDRDKRGYYYNVNERIIAARRRVSASSWYIINCGEGGAETGNNSNGKWVRDSMGNQICSYDTELLTLSSSASAGFYYASTRWVYPAPFLEKPVVIPTAIDNLAGLYASSLGNISASSFEYTNIHVDVEIYGTTASVNAAAAVFAQGKYTDFM
jgi:hypothetical protein